MRSHRRFAFVFTLLLVLAGCTFLGGCSGGSGGAVLPSGDVVVTEANTFVLQPNVRELPDDGSVTVGVVADDSVTLTGDVPDLQPGDVLIKNDGDDQFLRKVVSVTTEGGTTVVQTAPAVMTDVFQSADIIQTVNLGPEFLESLQPAMPGVTFGEPELVQSRGEEFAAFSLPVHFGDALIGSNGRGSVVGNGDITIRLALFKALNVGVKGFLQPTVNHFALVPSVEINGNLTLTGQGSGDFRQEFPLTGPFSYPLAGFGPVSLNLNGQLMLTVDGYVQAGASMAMHGGVKLECGLEAIEDQWRAIGELTPTFSVDAPHLTAEANLNVSLVQPRLSVGLLGMGDAFVNANLLRLEAEARLENNQYHVRVYRTFGVEAGAHLSLGVAPLVVRYDSITSLPFPGRVLVAEFGTPLPQPEPATVFNLVIPQSGTLKKGEQGLLFALSYVQPGLFPIPLPQPCTWSSSNNNAVRVTGYGFFGLVEGRGAGQARISATVPSGVTGISDLTVGGPTLQSIALVPESTSGRLRRSGLDEKLAARVSALNGDAIKELGTVDYGAVGHYSDGSTADLTYAGSWSSENGHVAVFRNGQVDGRLEGSSLVTVTDPLTGVVGQADVTVTRPRIRDLYITPQQPDMLQMTVGDELQVQAVAWWTDSSVRRVTNQMTWLAGNEEVLAVTAGRITALRPGLSGLLAFDPDTLTFDLRLVQVGQAPMTGLSLSPSSPGPFRAGDTQQFRAFAQYEGGGSEEVTNLVLWRTNDDSFGTLSATGLYTFRGAGDARVKAFYNGFTASTETFDCIGPAGFSFRSQPPGEVTPGQHFSLEVEVLDSAGETWTPPLDVTLELTGGPESANLAGTLTRTTSSGRALFTNLSVDQLGTGYRIQVLSPGLTVARSASFAAASAPPGHLFVNNRTSNGTGALTVLTINADGTVAATAGSPYDTANQPQGVVRVGNYIFVANGGSGTGANSLTRYAYDPGTGALSGRFDTDTDSLGGTQNQPIQLETNGSDALFVLTNFDRVLYSYSVDPGTGALTARDSLLRGWVQPIGLTFHDVPGSPTDLLLVSDVAGNAIHVLSYDAASGAVNEVAGSPFANPLAPGFPDGGGPTKIVVVDDNVYTINPNGAAITRFTLDSQTGALTPVAGKTTTGTSPNGMHARGNYLYVGNQVAGTISGFEVEADGSLTALNGGTAFPAGEINPHGFADVALTPSTVALYVTTSNRLAAFMLDPATGLLTAVAGSPFSGFGFASPGVVRH